jgi:hypothetical protein
MRAKVPDISIRKSKTTKTIKRGLEKEIIPINISNPKTIVVRIEVRDSSRSIFCLV